MTIKEEEQIEMKELNQSIPDEENNTKKIKFITYHPFVLIFYIIFKSIPLVYYFIVFFIFSDKFIICFSVTLLALAVDFWYTKNIAGRMLCGLRWWNRIDSNGKNEWLFECLSNENRVRLSQFEVICFWVGLLAPNLLWILTVLTCTLTFKPHYLVIVLIAALLATTNSAGFIRCLKTQLKQMKQKVKQQATEMVVKKATESVISSITKPSKN